MSTLERFTKMLEQVQNQIKACASELEFLEHVLATHKEEARKARERGPVWHRRSGEPMRIVEMGDGHLVYAILVCLRCDPRYFFGRALPARQVQLVNLVLEAQRRGLMQDYRIRDYMDNIREHAFKNGEHAYKGDY